MKYSEDLVKDIQDYYKKKCNVDLDEEIANEYLDSFADLYRCFKELIQQGFKGVPVEAKLMVPENVSSIVHSAEEGYGII
jgi:translation initiation factor 2 alpha subunit (eIF-2alpha)